MYFICTFTGVDEKTSLERLRDLSKQYEFVEFGILYSVDRAGNTSKYPSFDFINKILSIKEEYKLNLSLHLCGRIVNSLLASSDLYPNSDLIQLISKFNRVQLNFNVTDERYDCSNYVDSIPKFQQLVKIPVILQYNKSNKKLIEEIGFKHGFKNIVKNYRIDLLKDSSGGRGIETDDFSYLPIAEDIFLGFSGGFGLHNIEENLPKIDKSCVDYVRQQIARYGKFGADDILLHISIDMENNLRVNDYLDLDIVERIADKVNQFADGKVDWRSYYEYDHDVLVKILNKGDK